MSVKYLIVSALLSVFLLGTSAGCAKYATKDTKISGIEKKAPDGIFEEEFKQTVPNATLIEEKGTRKVYTVAVGQRCFWCGTKAAFLRSFEVYATKFTFEDGSLVAKERIVDGE
jgi:hypothetical protein